jgi:brefeldin A-resistance guanine nucleotide exchange factor 1
MVDGGYLTPPSENAESSEIWDETWKRVDRFLPDLYTQIFPEKTPPPPPTSVPTTHTTEEAPQLNEEPTDDSKGKPEETPASNSN